MQNLTYLLNQNEANQVWPDSQRLLDFVNSGVAAKNIELFVNDYIDQLPPLLSKVQNDVIELSVSATRTLRDRTRRLIVYDGSMSIDGSLTDR